MIDAFRVLNELRSDAHARKRMKGRPTLLLAKDANRRFALCLERAIFSI